MPRLILLLAVAITVVLLIRRVQALPPHKRRAGYLQLLFIGAAVAAVLLTLAGKMHWIGAALTGLLVAARQTFPVLIRAVPFLHQWWQRRQGPSGTQGQQSEVKSAILRMTLDHDTGELGGEVIAGPYREWQLDEMNREQLLELLAYCRDHDADSEQLLVGYLEQRFPDGYDPEGSDSSTRTNGDAGGGMNRQEALSILGLGTEATESDIVQAHRSLIQKLHPDRGGNDYLAAKINEAKDYLLKS